MAENLRDSPKINNKWCLFKHRHYISYLVLLILPPWIKETQIKTPKKIKNKNRQNQIKWLSFLLND